VALWTLARTLSGRAVVHVLDGGMSSTERRRIERVAGRAGRVDLNWVDTSTVQLAALPTVKHLGRATYLRLFLPDLIDVDRVIYLDADIQVRHDLGQLWATDLVGRCAAAVQDPFYAFVSVRGALPTWAELGLPARQPYFNAGVMVMDLLAWRDRDLSRQMVAYLDRHRDRLMFADQDAANAVVGGDVALLDARWNAISHWFEYAQWPTSHCKTALGPARERVVADPWVVHYAGVSKPWQVNCRHPLQGSWVRELLRCGWFDRGEALAWATRWYGRQLQRQWRLRWQGKGHLQRWPMQAGQPGDGSPCFPDYAEAFREELTDSQNAL
jgi:lipopolysaccharide biosynthesis glycosyltransferase